MAIFAVNQPVSTTVATVTVDNRFTPGKHTFQLVVESNSGAQSDPVKTTVVVAQGVPPPGMLAGPKISRPASKKTRRTGKRSADPPAVRSEVSKEKATPEHQPRKAPARKRTQKKPPRDNS